MGGKQPVPGRHVREQRNRGDLEDGSNELACSFVNCRLVLDSG